jgi:cell fate regulator YaaT (PSP1 superfamily)
MGEFDRFRIEFRPVKIAGAKKMVEFVTDCSEVICCASRRQKNGFQRQFNAVASKQPNWSIVD